MAYDNLLSLQSLVTKTATFNGTGLSTPNGTPRRGLVARVIYSAAGGASGTGTATFSVDYSSDGGSTWISPYVKAADIILVSTSKSGVAHIPFILPLSAENNASAQVRLTCTITAGTSPTITYLSDIGDAMP